MFEHEGAGAIAAARAKYRQHYEALSGLCLGQRIRGARYYRSRTQVVSFSESGEVLGFNLSEAKSLQFNTSAT